MHKALRILQVEDSESDAALIVRFIEKAGYTVASRRVEDAEDMRGALREKSWDVIVADHNVPQFDSGAALHVLHESGQDIPFIVVSGTIGEDRAVGLMKAGAHDYVLKDNLARLGPAIRREVGDAASRTGRKRAEEQLRERDEVLALAISATQLGIFDYYPQNGTLIWSDILKRQFGLSAGADVTYDIFLRGLHPDDRARVDGLVEYASRIQSGGRYAAEYRTIGIEDGVERWLTSHGRVFFDDAGLPVRFIGVTLDITQGKRLEEQFRQAQKLESIGQLAGGIAHDFNNLLTVITGYSQLILSEPPGIHPVRERIEKISYAAGRAADLTRQLLTFSRRQEPGDVLTTLNDVVQSFQNMLGRLIGENISLILSLDPAAGAIRAGAGQIEQILINLAVNARDAMPVGGKLLIETEGVDLDARFAGTHLEISPGRYASLSLTDTGSGMSEAVKAHLFEPFFTTKGPGQGTGLGLATVYGIVKQCGGSVSVYSEPGNGAKFRILFPAAPGVPNEIAMPQPDRVVHRGSGTILLAEDEANVRHYIHEILSNSGYTILACSNGREALETARNYAGPIHLLITDAVMPEIGGSDLAREFRLCRPGVPVISMSGYSDLVWPRAHAETAYIQKPFGPASLLAKVQSVLV